MDYYDILGIKKDSSLENIRRAYNREKFENGRYWDDKLNEAYSVLSNVEKRKEYDRQLEENERKQFFDLGTPSLETIETIQQEEEVVPQMEEDRNIYSNSGDEASIDSSEEEIEQEVEQADNSDLPDETTEDELEPQIEEDRNIYSNSGDEASTDSSGEEMDEEIEEVDNSDLSQEQAEVANQEETYEEIYDRIYSQYESNSQFDPVAVEKNQLNKNDSKFKTVAKYIGGGLLGFMSFGPLGAAGVIIWMKKHKKKKLVKDNKVKKITKITTSEMNLVEEYKQKLNKEINRLLSEPHNSYRLAICKAKYKNQIELLQKILELKTNEKSNKNMVLYKLDVMSTKNQLDTARKELAKIEKRIEDYDKKQKLTKLNNEIIEANSKLAEHEASREIIARQTSETELKASPIRLRRLEIKRSNLLKKRDKAASIVKFAVVKTGGFYDKIVKAKDFVKSMKHVFSSEDEIDSIINEEIEYTQRHR